MPLWPRVAVCCHRRQRGDSELLRFRRFPPVPLFPAKDSVHEKSNDREPNEEQRSGYTVRRYESDNIDGQPREDFRSLRPNQLVTTAVAADLLGITVRGLAGMRTKRIGPPFVRISPRCIRYSLGDLERFIMTKMVRTEADIDTATC